MSTKSFIRRAEQWIAGVRDTHEKKRRARELERQCQQRGRDEIRRMQTLKDDEPRARDIMRSPHARRWAQYLGAGFFFYLVDAGVQAWTYGKLTRLSDAGDVVAGIVTAGALAVVVAVINTLYVIDTYSEEVTRWRLRLFTGVGIGGALAGAIAYRVIGTLGSREIVHTTGWVPFAAMCLGLPLACASLTALGFYYRDARRAINRLSDSAARLKDLAALYYRLASVPEPDATAVELEAEVMPAWLDAAGELDVFGVPVAAALRPTEGALSTGTPETPPEAPASARKRRGRPRGSRKRLTIPDPVQDSFAAPDFNSTPKNGNNAGEPIIPPVVRGLAVLVCLLLGGRALAASCFIGTDGTASNNPSELADVDNFTVSTAHELTAAFGCDTVVTSVVTDQGRWTPRRRLPVPVRPDTRDCSSAISESASDASKLYGAFKSLQDEDDRNASLACKRKNQESLRVFDEAQQDFENQLRASLTVHEARADVRSPIFAWLAGAVGGSETPAVVVLIGDGLENPPWPRPLPHLAVSPGTTIVLLLVPPRPLYRDPQQALADVEVWHKVVPGIVVVPAPELRSGIWADIARRRRS